MHQPRKAFQSEMRTLMVLVLGRWVRLAFMSKCYNMKLGVSRKVMRNVGLFLGGLAVEDLLDLVPLLAEASGLTLAFQ